MRFAALVDVYERLEGTTKRLEMTEQLRRLFQAVPIAQIGKVVYLTQGTLLPEFKGLEMGLAEKLVLRALAFTTGLTAGEVEGMWKRLGDMGTVAEEILSQKKQRTLFGAPLTVQKVYDNLVRIAQASGTGSQDEKIKLLADLLHDSTPKEARYILRIIVGKMRLGVADMTIIDALAAAFASKEERGHVERAYNVSSDLGTVAGVLARGGLEGLEEIHLQVGIPVRAMLCERLPGLEQVFEKLGKCALEYKYDGLRIQAHIGRGIITLFSRRLEDLTEQFPDILQELSLAFKGREAILEGEAVPIDVNTGALLPFQEVSHRRGRKYDIAKVSKETPVHLLLFDCLYLDGQELIERPYTERRDALERSIKTTEKVRLAETLIAEEPKDAEDFFEQAIDHGCEGLIAKALDSPYAAGARGWQWIKYKRDYKAEMADTVDLVIVGAFAGRGRRAGTYGALLMTSYDPEEDLFRSVCKLGSGFDDEALFSLPEKLKRYEQEGRHTRVDSRLEADQWFEPALVLEVLGAEITLSPTHTCAFEAIREGSGLAIRFPRFTGRWRGDKGPRDATTDDEILSMYRSQLKKVG
ncbi:MAG: ATP-dependent DNA ligase [Candidatus Thermoplasmatota archaeon]|nr:ATP-dependent DNA ligase [Candidatus Thermoplasmatota archaeon]